jgi:hypothetical protein
MARHLLFAIAFAAAASVPLAAQTFSFNTGDASLDVTLNSINVQAQANIGPYTADLSASFGVGQPQIQVWLTENKLQPAEVFLVLEMGKIASKPPATVIAVYKKNKGKGWGAVAKALGIKPGSPEFKALKGSADERDRKTKGGKKK